jgi:LysM repeat protein
VARRRRDSRRRTLVRLAVVIGIAGLLLWWAVPHRPGPTADKHASEPAMLVSSIAAPPTDGGTEHSPLVKIESSDRTAGTTPDRQPEATPPNTPSPSTRPVSMRSGTHGMAAYQAGQQAYRAESWLTARQQLSQAVRDGLPAAQEGPAMEMLGNLADRTLFSPDVLPDDPHVSLYSVKSGDTIARIAKAHHISADLLARINRLQNKHLIRVNQTLKVINGPFHAVVDKSHHAMFITIGDTYVRRFAVALGMEGRTPTGTWVVKDKLSNPSWVDPRTGKRWNADDPQNPIGEYWIGLRGTDGDAIGQEGFGIHGTIEEETLGRDVSLGCIRLGAAAIEEVYQLLVREHSTVVVEP